MTNSHEPSGDQAKPVAVVDLVSTVSLIAPSANVTTACSELSARPMATRVPSGEAAERATSPSVIYDVYPNNGDMIQIQNPTHLPGPGEIQHIEEPVVKATLITPEEFVGAIMDLCQTRRGVFKNMEYPSEGRCTLHYEMPLGEIGRASWRERV